MGKVQWYVYVIKSIEGLNYVGMTRNRESRLSQYNQGLSKWTRRGTSWKIVYFEEFDSAAAAREREKYFKNIAGREWLRRRGYL